MVAVPEGSRFQAWAALLVFSSVCLAAHASSLDSSKTSSEKWVLAMLSISLTFSFFGVVAYSMAKDKFVGQTAEGGLAGILLIFWCAGLPTIMNPNTGIAIIGIGVETDIKNSNLYFFSWISFMCVLYILGHYSQEVTGREFSQEVSPKNAKWGGLFATSIVLLASAAQIFIDAGCKDFKIEGYCGRTSYAISLGAIGMVFPAIIIFMTQKGKLNAMCENISTAIMLIIFVFGVGFITFGNGPATRVSNLYFSTWIGFIITVLLSAQCFREFMIGRSEGAAGEEPQAAPAQAFPDVEQEGATEGFEVPAGKQ